VIVCPRHPERGDVLAALISANGAVGKRTSRGGRVESVDEVLVVDEIGKLSALYACTAATVGIAVVGGSLGSGRGGQNMLEAAAAGCCTVVGRDTRNFPDAMASLRTVGGVVEVDADGIHIELERLAADRERRRGLGERARTAWAADLGATDRAVVALAGLFAPRGRAGIDSAARGG
jgi:3-deoxy-D-manno-octulosonic-acid transferase